MGEAGISPEEERPRAEAPPLPRDKPIIQFRSARLGTYCVPFPRCRLRAFIKLEFLQRRLAWPLRKDDTLSSRNGSKFFLHPSAPPLGGGGGGGKGVRSVAWPDRGEAGAWATGNGRASRVRWGGRRVRVEMRTPGAGTLALGLPCGDGSRERTSGWRKQIAIEAKGRSWTRDTRPSNDSLAHAYVAPLKALAIDDWTGAARSAVAEGRCCAVSFRVQFRYMLRTQGALGAAAVERGL